MISLFDSCILGLLAAVALFYTYYYTRYLAGVQRRVRHYVHHRFRWKPVVPDADSPAEPEAELPGVSVIVSARNEADNLRHYLQALTCQRYPRFEVIVVNDGSEDDTQLVLEHYAHLFPNLHLTFVPHQAWVRSSKKLALTLAAKAAKYDYLLLTDADCRPESPHWIEEMMKGFRDSETELVLGYGGYFREPGLLNRLQRYETISTALTYLGFALSRHPYMGVGRNLAYRKDTFFGHNGFQGLLGQRAGDDDLLVNKIATRHNTEVVITPDSFTWSVPKHTYAEWRQQKYRHLSVSPCYRFSTRLRLALEPCCRGLLYALCIALTALQMPRLALVAWSVLLVRLLWLWLLTNRAAGIFRTSGFGLLETLAYDIYLPLFTLVMLIRHAFRRKREMQW